MKKRQADGDAPTADTRRALTVELAEAFMHDAASEFVRAHNEWSGFKGGKPARTLVVQIAEGRHFRVLSYLEEVSP